MNKIDVNTSFYLLIGNPVSHSLSPALYNAAFSATGLNCCYLASEVPPGSLGEAVAGMRALNIAGGNVTAPYKEEIMGFLDWISPEAELIKSVNTLVNRGGRLHGFSTDGSGFCRFLREKMGGSLYGCTVLIAGAGGAARAVSYSLANEGVQSMVIANRTPQRAEHLADILVNETSLQGVFLVPLTAKSFKETFQVCQVVVNCLPFDDPGLLCALKDPSLSLKHLIFVDLRYNPEETELMKAVREKGGQACNGKGMLMYQAAAAFELFTGGEAPVEKMQEVLGSW